MSPINNAWISRVLGINSGVLSDPSYPGIECSKKPLVNEERRKVSFQIDSSNCAKAAIINSPSNHKVVDKSTHYRIGSQSKEVLTNGAGGTNDGSSEDLIVLLEKRNEARKRLKLRCLDGKKAGLRETTESRKEPLPHNDKPIREEDISSKEDSSWASEDSGFSSCEESSEAYYLMGRGESSKVGLGADRGEISNMGLKGFNESNIVIELGEGPSNNVSFPVIDGQFNMAPERLNEVKDRVDNEAHLSYKNAESPINMNNDCLSSQSVSHVSETLSLQQNSEKASQLCVGMKVMKNSYLKKAAKPSSSVKSHGMKTRKDNYKLVQSGGDGGTETIWKNSSKGRRILEEEASKVSDQRGEPGSTERAVVIGGDGSNNVGNGNIGEEVAKVIEIGLMRKPRRTEGYEQFELRLSGAIDSSAFPPVPTTISMMYIRDLTNSPGSEYDPSSDQPVQSPYFPESA
ncbi:hypothetical protein Q3G72_024650 [Acer saccharum]|nr:hypothetical protein Q3G72_024650 [Acer saccharum]